MSKTSISVILSLFLCLAAQAQQPEETVVFKFVLQNDMFYVPWAGNGSELDRLCQLVEQYRTQIQSGEMPVHVDGYCADLPTARNRSNRVKSELITQKGLKEEHFITHNHAGCYEGKTNVVVVSFRLPPAPSLEAVEVQAPKPAEQPVPPRPVEETQPTPSGGGDPFEQPATPLIKTESGIFLRTNLLYWAAATPNLGIEYKPSGSFGILVNGAYSPWIGKGGDRQYRSWLVQPELRYYLGENKHWFLGLEGHAAQFNLKFDDTGYQGDALGGGLTGGYRLQLSRHFDMDFSLGLGYTQLKYDSYYRSNSVMVRKESGVKKNVFAPTQAGVSLIFKL